jgi:hypothetical protein
VITNGADEADDRACRSMADEGLVFGEVDALRVEFGTEYHGAHRDPLLFAQALIGILCSSASAHRDPLLFAQALIGILCSSRKRSSAVILARQLIQRVIQHHSQHAEAIVDASRRPGQVHDQDSVANPAHAT